MNFFINLLAPLTTMFFMNMAVYRDLRKLWSKHNTFRVTSSSRRKSSTSRSRQSSVMLSTSMTSNIHPPSTPIGSCASSRQPLMPTASAIGRDSLLPVAAAATATAMEAGGGVVTPELGSPAVASSSASCSEAEHQERERDVRYTRASIVMVVMFVVCHAPRLITNTAEIFTDQADMPEVS